MNWLPITNHLNIMLMYIYFRLYNVMLGVSLIIYILLIVNEINVDFTSRFLSQHRHIEQLLECTINPWACAKFPHHCHSKWNHPTICAGKKILIGLLVITRSFLPSNAAIRLPCSDRDFFVINPGRGFNDKKLRKRSELSQMRANW